MASTLQRLRAHKKVEHVDVEPGNGVIVTLKRGWSWDAGMDNRVRGEDTASEMLRGMRLAAAYAGPYDN